MEEEGTQCGCRKRRRKFVVRKWTPHLVILLLQFFFRFAQGQGPGNAFSVYENRAPDTLVGTIQTESTYTYSFGDNSDARDYFNLDAITGRITTKVRIDRESLNLQENKFNFLILGQSSQGSNIPVEVSVEILDENDNKPTFPNQSEIIRFRENSQVGTQQFAPSATDIDYGNNSVISQYKIIAGDGPFTIFYNRELYGDVPIIQTTGSIDREKISSYMLTIQAIDSGKPPQSGTTIVQVLVEDMNDHAPEFVPSEHYARVNETDPIGTFVVQVVATDLDAGVNQDITYEIENTNDGYDQFRIEPNTGEIFTTTQPLYCQDGQCTLIIKARDNGVPSYTGRAFVYITVIDTNNHDPVIRFKYVPAGNNFSSVNEDATDGDIVAGVLLSDPDAGSTPTVRIIAGNELQHFRLEPFISGQLYYVKVNGDSVLDRERHYFYNITFEARDSGNPPRTSANTLTIYINDINDHAPVFANRKVTLAISETTPVGSFIASMLANDLDSGINAKLTYDIVKGNDPEWFYINPDTGLVTTQTRLHYEEQYLFRMNISVHDGALHPLKDYAELEISIWDENDMAPKFSQTVFNVSLEENQGSVLPVVFASAEDHDSGLNGSLTYLFHPHVEQLYPGTFHINSDTGEVTTKRSLDREEISDYTIRILAKDKGSRPLTSTATVFLHVIDVNDNSPVFYPTNYFAKVIEGQGRGTTVVKVTASDPDEGDNGKVIYSFSSSDFGKFVIDSATGIITTKGDFTKAERSSYFLTVIAKDSSGSRQDTATVQVSVVSPTDSLPYFTSNSYQFSIPEDPGTSAPQYVGVNVGKVTAKVDSATSSIGYRIISGDPSGVFSIEMATGFIRRNKSVDRETVPVYKLIVVANVGDLFATSEVVITVNDNNDNAPVFDFAYLELDLIENWPVGHEIARIQATDADEGPNSKLTYSLQRDANNMFGIQADTGLLYLNKPLWMLSSGSVNLTVVAMDAGMPPFTASQELRLKVKDVNNHSPKFSHTTFELSLVESHPVNSRFFHAAAVDMDLGENGRLTYNISRGNEDGKFGIFPDGYLYIAKKLDRETKDLYKLSVIAHDHGVQPRSSECNITIHVTDFNDNKPIFLNASYSFSLPENRPAGVLIGHVRASDADMGRNAELSYFFKIPQTDFHLDLQNGEITSLKAFDREALSASDYTVSFDVLVKDNGLTRLEDVATVRVKILDENDNAPVFRQQVYRVTKFENEPRFSNVTVVRAEDADDGISKIVTYNIISGNDDGVFKVDATTGQITLDKQLDRETQDFYELTIKAVDSGESTRYSALCKVQITVSDINDNFPLFAQSQMDIMVREDVSLGREVAHFLATDIDLGVNAEITYLLSGTDDDGTFGIDRHTGRIYLLKKLDYETKKNYKLNVTAKDGGVPSLTYYIRFSITIEDVNDNAPLFQNAPIVFSVTENSSGSIAQIKATDADSGKNGEVQYHIAYQDPPGTNFKIVKNNGQIYIDQPVDREVVNLYKVTVVATDQAEDESQRLSTETIVTINVEDQNDNEPLVTSFNAIAVPYSTPVNEYITTIKVEDKDSANNGKFAMQLLQTGTNHFTLDSNLGRLHLTNRFQDPSVKKYPVTIQTSDYGIPNQLTSSMNVVVIVTNDNDGPIFQSSSYSGKIAENSAMGTSIFRVQALSRQNSPVEYYITNITLADSGEQVGRYFQIDKTSGVVSPAYQLDREKVGDKFQVEIFAIDTAGSQPSTSKTYAQIELLDVNDTPPRFSQNFYTVSVDEDVRVDFPVVRVAVYDDDSLGGLQLTLNAGSDVNLKINQDGTIVTTGPLDRETTPQYTLRITATDGIQSSSCMVRINLQDVNDNAPAFTQSFYSFDIAEDTLIDTTVGSIKAVDPDEGPNGEVTYSLSAGWGNDTFSLDPVKGTFTLLRLLDFEENQLYTVEVIASDHGDPAQSSSILVYFNVKDTNDNTPLFEHGTYDVAIQENVTKATSVVQVQAFDVDSGMNGEVAYSIIDGDTGGQFQINPETGTIYTASSLDRETTPNYTLVVKATDRAEKIDDRKTATAEVLLTILDVNDNTPEIIAPPIIGVRENLPQGTVVYSFQVRDPDEGVNGQVQFSMVSQSGGAIFSIGTYDGQLRVQADLDRESVQNYSLIIGVHDLGKPSLSSVKSVFIKVEDENDHSPVFSSIDKIDVKENVQIGTTLLQVSATDLDSGLNGIVKYFIISGDDNSDFSLDQSSGVLRVQKNLDYERLKEYRLVIQAEDSGDDVRYSSATVSISVQDVNDNVPLFLDSPYVGFVRENMDSLPVHVLHVSAHDEDSPPYNQLQYAIRGDNWDLFSMNATSGEIKALKTLDRESVSSYTLTVVATDSATGRGLTGSGTVSVFVEDVNDNPPVFDQVGSYVAHVSENAVPDTEVTVVRATDMDEGSNAQIIYQLKDSIGDKFMIYPNTGRIATRVRLDREEVSEYTLEVIAMDASLVPLSSNTSVIVYIDDVNDNAPQFESNAYVRSMQLPVGQGTFVIGATASDLDAGNNRLVEYKINQGDAGMFSIDAKTGVITARQSLVAKTYTFVVTAQDKGSPVQSSTASVTITVATSTGVTAPTFDPIQTGLKVIENIPIHTNITKVKATSAYNAAITYSIAGGNLGDAFAVDGISGRIYVANTVDYELIQEYHLWIKVTESGSGQVYSYAEVVLGIEDMNDNEPWFSKPLYNISIPEDVQFASTIVTVMATDADSGSNGAVTYSLAGADVTNFRIDSKTGKISTYTNLDRETKEAYSLIVTATDSGNPRKSSTASVRVNVLDVNDNRPSFTHQFRVTIPENMEVGSFVLRVTSTDQDLGQNAVATYSLTEDAAGTFRIDSVSGNITLTKQLDAEKNATYRLRVLATDGAHDVEGNVEIDVGDVNDNSPTLNLPYSFDIEEMLPPGSHVGQLSASDADIKEPNNQVYFSLKMASSYFDLDSNTGDIVTLEELTFDPSVDLNLLPNRHELVVIVKDLGTPVRSTEQTIYVNVKDYNDHPPVFDQPAYQSAVPYTTAVGNSIISVNAVDENDFGDNAKVEYFVSGGNGSELFGVDRFSGIIAVKQELYGSLNKQYIVVVKAEDKGSVPQSSSVNVRLFVTGENQNAPVFKAPATNQITVDENQSNGSLIETFVAQDSDTSLNAEVFYEITAGNEDNLFIIGRDNGKLVVNGILDYENNRQFTLDITARDKGMYSKHTTRTYTVYLRDLNDNDPIFGQTVDTVFVDENSPVGTSVYHAVAVDIDSGNNAVIQYAIVGEPQNKFQINGTTGVVTSKGDLDYETTIKYTLTIMALNPNSERKSTMSLTIHIEGVNEYVPKFARSMYNFSISESAPPKTSVGQVYATDQDDGPDGIVNYFLIGESNAKGFKVDPRTGVILVSGKPDYESSPRITLQVLAKNWGSVKGNDTDTCVVHISVQDANDPPRFTQTVYQATVLENSGADVSVTTVVAEDTDFDPADRLFTYVILSGNSPALFKINSKTGYISTTGAGVLDRETIPVYNITVGAVDQGSPPETGSAVVQVLLDDVNDNGPYFKNFTARVTEGQNAGITVTNLTLYTADLDSVKNQGPYTYKKLTDTHFEYDYFDIIERTGEVRTKKVLDRETTPEFVVPVIVLDGGSPTMSSTLSFKVLVSDINDTPPAPRFLTIFLSIYNGKHPQGVIADIRPVDQDIDGKPTCALTGSSVPFYVAPNSCSLMLNEDPAQTSYTLEVQGSDGVYAPVTYDISVKITNFDNATLDNTLVLQVDNLTPDEFMQKSYSKFHDWLKLQFDSRDQVLIFALMPQTSGDLLIYLAVQKPGIKDYYLPADVKQKISNAKNNTSGVFIVSVGYSKCQNSYCQNGGQCASHVTVGSSNQNADSINQAFSNPALDLISYCSCLPQFTGPDCSQPAAKCGNLYCQNGASCVEDGIQKYCQCTDGWSGASCENDINECVSNICQNGGTCENTAGSFICHCMDGFSGRTCQDGQNFCQNDPCLKGTCTNLVDGFKCECPYSYWGDLCQYTSIGFSESSYMVFTPLAELNNELEVIFATESERALLLYNPSSVTGSGEFLALEILDGKVRFSAALETGQVMRINIDKKVNTGAWFKVKVNRNRDMSRIWVENCPEDGGLCEECQIGTPCYSQQQTSDERLEVGSHPLFIGGVKNIDTILNRTGQVNSHDFVGCMRSFIINGQDKLTTIPQEKAGILDECPRKSQQDLCSNYECQHDGVCVGQWSRPVCHCTAQYSGDHCEKALEPFQFSLDSFVRITMKETVRRDTQLDAASAERRRRSTQDSSVLVRFRTTSSDGLLLFASTFSGNRISVLSVVAEQLTFTIKQYGATNSVTISTPVSDSDWHNATVHITASEVALSLDQGETQRLSVAAFSFNSPDVKELTLGGSSSPVTIDNKNLQAFTGCISVFELDGERLPMNGTSSRFTIQTVGGVGNGCMSLCANDPCDGQNCEFQGEVFVCDVKSSEDQGLNIGIIIMIVFFVIILIAIVVVFIVFRQRRKLCMKPKQHKQNGVPFTNSANSSGTSNPDSGYGENNIDKIIIGNHIRQELAGTNFQRQNGCLTQPDILKSDVGRTPMPLEMEDGTVIIDNASDLTHLRDLNGDMPELYDIENASSIAPSDIDVVDHYRHFHDGGRNRRKNKAQSDHSHHSKNSSRHYQSNQGSHSHHSHEMRESPNLTSVPYLNDLARGSPANVRNSPLNQLSRQSPNVRQSPLTHVNMHGHNMPVTDLNGGSRTTSERSLASHRSKNSSSTPNKPKRQMLPNGNLPSAQKPLNHNYENGKFLTLEEVDRLNARPRESPASLMEAFSTSSENNTRKMQKPFDRYQDTSVLLEPPESSSDDSANDSFTCSEYEGENDKPRNDFNPTSRIFSNLTEVDNENEDGAYLNKNFKSDGLDSGGNSFSSNERSSDENQGQTKIPNNAFNWDDLLNWGPKFEKLVGVFTDIALLPDADSEEFNEAEGKSTEREEYV